MKEKYWVLIFAVITFVFASFFSGTLGLSITLAIFSVLLFLAFKN